MYQGIFSSWEIRNIRGRGYYYSPSPSASNPHIESSLNRRTDTHTDRQSGMDYRLSNFFPLLMHVGTMGTGRVPGDRSNWLLVSQGERSHARLGIHRQAPNTIARDMRSALFSLDGARHWRINGNLDIGYEVWAGLVLSAPTINAANRHGVHHVPCPPAIGEELLEFGRHSLPDPRRPLGTFWSRTTLFDLASCQLSAPSTLLGGGGDGGRWCVVRSSGS